MAKGKAPRKRNCGPRFAGRVDLSPAEYAEVESGIVHWVGTKQENLIPILLGMNTSDEAQFNYKLRIAREQAGLEFADVYSEDELSPARCCTVDGKQINEDTRKAIIKAVFTPLPKYA